MGLTWELVDHYHIYYTVISIGYHLVALVAIYFFSSLHVYEHRAVSRSPLSLSYC